MGAVTLLVATAAVLVSGGITPLDGATARWAAGAPEFLVDAAEALDVVGSTLAVALLVLLLSITLLVRRDAWGAVRVASIFGATLVASFGLKLLIARPRPDAMLVEASGFAFPSGHAALAAALAGLFVWRFGHARKGRLPYVFALVGGVWALVMAASRVVLHVHSATDVLGGLALGAMTVGLGLAAFHLVDPR